MSWTHFTTEKLDDGSRELRCCKHPEAPLRVREVPPARTGGAHQKRVVAVCTECNRDLPHKARYVPVGAGDQPYASPIVRPTGLVFGANWISAATASVTAKVGRPLSLMPPLARGPYSGDAGQKGSRPGVAAKDPTRAGTGTPS
jgi:hypothetical protein